MLSWIALQYVRFIPEEGYQNKFEDEPTHTKNGEKNTFPKIDRNFESFP